MTDQYAEEKRWVFSFDVKEESEDECLTERGREFQITGPIYWKDLFPRVRLPYARNKEYSSIRGWAKRVRRRVEMKQLREVWRFTWLLSELLFSDTWRRATPCWRRGTRATSWRPTSRSHASWPWSRRRSVAVCRHLCNGNDNNDEILLKQELLIQN